MKMIAGNSAHTSGQQDHVDRIVIHGTVSPCVLGGARSVARFFQSAGAGGSAHYVVDPGEVIQSYTERTICWHAPPNTGSIGVELCDPQKGPSSRWADDAHERMLVRAAELVRQIASRWGVPLRRLSAADLKAGRRGICGHADVSAAFHKTDHTDPGEGFPWGHFMELVLQDSKESDDVDAKTLWQHELPVPFGSKENPEWQAGNILVNIAKWTRDIQGKLDAQNATIKTLVDALAAHDDAIDADALMAKITEKIESITVRLDVPDSPPTS